jgi:hypothetical protein
MDSLGKYFVILCQIFEVPARICTCDQTNLGSLPIGS